MQNLVTIPQGVSFPRMREIAHQMFTPLLFLHRSHKMLLCQRHLIDKRHSAVCRSAELAISQIFWLTATHAAAGCQPLQPPGKLIFIVINILQLAVPFQCRHHSLSNKQLFNFSENRRPEVVFIGVNYVTFVSGYDPSANLSGVLL